MLAIDTSLGTSVGVVSADGRPCDAVSTDPLRHAEVIGTLIAEALAQANAVPADITEVICGVGPGPFTGLRVGIAAAHAFAAGRAIPVRSFVSHDAIALEEYDTASAEDVVVVTDARRREVYWSRYSPVPSPDEGLQWRRISGPTVSKADDLPAGIRVIDGNSTGLRASSLIELAERMRAADIEPESGEALYLRSPDVTPSNGLKRVTN
nr:tRNA (adenosine(37)-N6)-threonylcarbamoyltransferase complex dimerization subunit type 1 TsaB [Lysinibacter cavernae]